MVIFPTKVSIYYDQLGSYYSDQPNDNSLWTTERFVEEVEQVRIALGADSSNFLCFRTILGRNTSYGICLKISK
jgi:proline iminopeptidase